MIADVIRAVVKRYPEIVKHLKGNARRYAVFNASKTFETMSEEVSEIVEAAYSGDMGTVEFASEMANIIRIQITNAFHNAWIDSDYGGEEVYMPFPAYLEAAQSEFIASANDTQYIYQFFNDIIDARIKQSSLNALISRGGIWANRWNEAYNAAMLLIESQTGGNLVWVLGETDKSCTTCKALEGVVASADEWAMSPYKPQGSALECGGWNCKCSLSPTDEKRTRGRKRILEI